MATSHRAGFVHLHNHSEYSLLDGLIRISDKKGGPSEALRALARDGAPGFAITDHGNMYGAVEFYLRCREAGVKPIIGCELYFSKTSRRDKPPSQKETCHLTVLAKDHEGYQNLIELSSLAFTEGYHYDPRIDRELLARHRKGLIVLSGCLKSELAQCALSGDLKKAADLAVSYRDILEPDSFYLEIMDHGLPDQRRVLEAYLELHAKTGIPLVATNDCHYPGADDADAHDARVAISTGKKLSDEGRLRFESRDFYIKTAQQMAKLFSFAPSAVSNTVEIADRCSLEIPMGRILLPEFKVPDGETQDSYLLRLCREGLKARLGGLPPAYEERLSYELGIIRKMGFAGYFLIVWDFTAFARRQNIPVGPGRGSGAGALVAYALNITSVDPLKHRLLFERFLNPERKAMPDLDIDLADVGREAVIDYVRNKYGAQNVAQIVTFGTMAARLVVRDVGRVMGLPISAVDRFARLIPSLPGSSLSDAIRDGAELKEASQDPQTKKLFELSLKLEGLKRHSSVHAAGIVITKEPVTRYAPLAKNLRSDSIVTQYDGDILGRLGLLKIDFLGLRTLSIIDEASRLIRRRGNPSFDISSVPENDPKTFELLRQGSALAVFQLDSTGIRDLLVRIKPSQFNDIVSIIALYRPGPMKSGMLDAFVERKNGRTAVSYDHPLQEGILKDTYGCVVFQEQVMEVAKTLADFTPAQADALRKAMGKKIPKEIEAQREAFVRGAANHKIAPKLANKIFDGLAEFGGYGFNKSHSVAYGVVAYQTAYLKANHPLEFMCAVLNSEIGHSSMASEEKENKLAVYMKEAQRMGIAILPPDANRSEGPFSIEGPCVRFGLSATKNVGTGAADSIVALRRDRPFESLSDLCLRLSSSGGSANKKTLESLAKAGALDGLYDAAGAQPLESRRAGLLKRVEEVSGASARLGSEIASGQQFLFDPAGLSGAQAPALARREVLEFEKEVLGVYFSGHPLQGLERVLAALSTHSAESLSQDSKVGSGSVRLVGLIRQVKRMTTKGKSEPWARVTLEDLTGELPVLVFPKAYASGIGARLKTGEIVAVSGRLSLKANSSEKEGEHLPEIVADDLVGIEEAFVRYARRIRLDFPKNGAASPQTLLKLKSILSASPGPCAVALSLETEKERFCLELESGVTPSANLLESLEGLLGPDSWRIENAF